jgi:hypothetical protein
VIPECAKVPILGSQDSEGRKMVLVASMEHYTGDVGDVRMSELVNISKKQLVLYE